MYEQEKLDQIHDTLKVLLVDDRPTEIDAKELAKEFEKQTPVLSNDFKKFLECVDSHGAHATIWEDGEKRAWNIPKGSCNHPITDNNLIDFRPLTRQERRDIFPEMKKNYRSLVK